ncbi:sodium-dependent symporter family protein [Hyphomonas hirschiana VP5]|uniref:Transporter n=1 Tax=Hyphomonas hirschiana VP5 TaxID=1280951 RepID=A0A059FSN1_9PROT|nr:sodium-dependent transporter [Hyphomonas hirschiana]KCZ93700.1 sodium-dependent symporter family protein [Hyphomonas hirschiana VP5]
MADIGRKSETFSSRFGFIMASVGSAVGLGNFWRFPYTAGENGGGAFILIYILCVAFIALPLLMAEYAMGRKSGMSAIEGVQSLARAESRSQNWGIVTWIGSLTAFFILSFYMVISAWLIAYVIQAIGGNLSGTTAEESGQNFLNTIGQGEHPLNSKWYILMLLGLFIVANIYVVGRGVKGGLERAATILMPLFFVMVLVVVGFSLANGDVARTVSFIFEPKWEDVGFKTFLAALGQAFFSISVGVGLMITYGAYLDRATSIPKSSVIIAGSDTFVALIAGFAIFPIVFAAGLNEGSGPSLFFVSMPVAFEAIPGGAIFAVIFFSLALFAAFTSSISLMEVGVSWLEERQGVTRSVRRRLCPLHGRGGVCLLARISRLHGLHDRRPAAAARRFPGCNLCRLDSQPRDAHLRTRRGHDHECLAVPDPLVRAALHRARPGVRLHGQDPGPVSRPAAWRARDASRP